MNTSFLTKIIALFLAVIGVLVAALQSTNQPGTDPSAPDQSESIPTQTETTPAPQPGSPEWVDQNARQLLDSLSLREKVGQLFLVAPEALQIQSGASYSSTVWNDAMTQTLQDYPVGGIILFGANVSTPAQLQYFTTSMRLAFPTAPFIAIDEEGGRVARIGRNSNFDVPRYDSMEAVGNTGDPQNAYEAGLAIGTYLQEYGLNVDFAPVADMNTNPNNVVIGDRAFGNDPQLVSDMVNAAIDGFHKAGIITSIKHFPGHGDTTGDTHDGYVAVTKSWEELKNCELIPFIAALDNTDMVMAAHITLPNITTDGLPASLSHEILTEKLRGELGYQGVIVTDSLSMGAIIQNYSPPESVKTAFLAGADILLMPQNFTEGFDGLVAAIETGEISEERLNESVLRILKLKIQYGIIDCT